MKTVFLAAGAALLSLFATGASAVTPLTVTYTGSLSGINTTYNAPYNVPVIFTGITTAEDAADGTFNFSSFSGNYGGDISTISNAAGSLVGGLFRISAGGSTFADFNFTGGFPSFTTGVDYAVTVSGGDPFAGAFGSAIIQGGSGTLRGDLGASNVPEPASWAMMVLGFGATGFAMRRRAKVATRISYAQ